MIENIWFLIRRGFFALLGMVTAALIVTLLYAIGIAALILVTPIQFTYAITQNLNISSPARLLTGIILYPALAFIGVAVATIVPFIYIGNLLVSMLLGIALGFTQGWAGIKDTVSILLFLRGNNVNARGYQVNPQVNNPFQAQANHNESVMTESVHRGVDKAANMLFNKFSKRVKPHEGIAKLIELQETLTKDPLFYQKIDNKKLSSDAAKRAIARSKAAIRMIKRIRNNDLDFNVKIDGIDAKTIIFWIVYSIGLPPIHSRNFVLSAKQPAPADLKEDTVYLYLYNNTLRYSVINGNRPIYSEIKQGSGKDQLTKEQIDLLKGLILSLKSPVNLIHNNDKDFSNPDTAVTKRTYQALFDLIARRGDISPEGLRPNVTRAEAYTQLIECFYQIQRSKNLDDEGKDDGNPIDRPACPTGSHNKTPYGMQAIIPDIEIPYATQETAMLKLTALFKLHLKKHITEKNIEVISIDKCKSNPKNYTIQWKIPLSAYSYWGIENSVTATKELELKLLGNKIYPEFKEEFFNLRNINQLFNSSMPYFEDFIFDERYIKSIRDGISSKNKECKEEKFAANEKAIPIRPASVANVGIFQPVQNQAVPNEDEIKITQQP